MFTFLTSKLIIGKKKLVVFWRKITLTRRICYTIGLLILFVVAGTFTAPGVNIGSQALASNSFLGVLDLVGGGGLRRFSVVALGISPFITASLIMQVLQTKLFPPVHQLSQMGPLGRRKINIITRLLTIFLSYTQAISVINLLKNTSGVGITVQPQLDTVSFNYVSLPLILMAGSLFSLFLAEQITKNGVGNGTSLIIYTGIALSLPNQFIHAFYYLIGSSTEVDFSKGVLNFIVYVVVFIVLVVVVSFVFNSERRVPIQQLGVGLSYNNEQLSWLPIKANPAGIMPLIFASIVLSFPFLITGFLNQHTSLFRYWVERNLRVETPLGFGIFSFLTLSFSVFLSIQQTRIDRIIEDFNKSATFVPGIRPGEPTEEYLISVVTRLSMFSAIYLLCIGSFHFVQQQIGLPHYITFGGTSVVILITSSFETVSQIIARRKANQLVILKQRIRKLTSESTKTEEQHIDLLW